MPRTSLRRTATAAAVATGAALAAAGALPAQAQPAASHASRGSHGDWTKIGDGMTSGVSGIVATARHGAGYDALVVRDNKKPGENRLAAVTHQPGGRTDVHPLDWRGSRTPVDLESVDAVPGEPGSYVAVASEGIGYRFDVQGGAAHVRDVFPLPALGDGDNIEDFALTARHGHLAAVWADRGQDERPATLYAAPFSVDDHGETGFGAVTHHELRAPYPHKDVRHASDLKVTGSGALLVSSASDPGDDGPFDSAVYEAGHLSLAHDGGMSLEVAKDPRVLAKFGGHKVEALACLPGSRQAVLGTDDENGGGSLRTAPLCGR